MPRRSSPKSRLVHDRRHAHLSLSPKSGPKAVYSLLRSVAGSYSSSFSSSNFFNSSSPRESTAVFADYLRSDFSVSQPKALRSRARGYLSELRRTRCLEDSHFSFCFHFSFAEFFVVATKLSPSAATGPDKLAYSMLKHLPRSGMNFLARNLSWYLHSFPSIWKASSIILFKLFERIIRSRLVFFPESSILSFRQAGSILEEILLFFLVHFKWV